MKGDLGTYLYGLSRDRMRSNLGYTKGRTRGNPYAVGSCTNMLRRGVEGYRRRREASGHRGRRAAPPIGHFISG